MNNDKQFVYKIDSDNQKVRVVELLSDIDHLYVWVLDRGKRMKESLSSLYAMCPENETIFSQLESINKQIRDLEALRRKTILGLKRIVVQK